MARTREILRDKGITHVVNCVRWEHENYFENELKYLGLYLQDSNQEDIVAVLYDVFNFIESAREVGGNVYIHCSQGVSRSAALTIAYTMWRTNKSFETVLDELKQARGIVEPNFGFHFQLKAWGKRRSTPVEHCNIYRIAPQSKRMPTYLVPKVPLLRSTSLPTTIDLNCLDPRGAFVLHCPEKVYLWIGDRCPEAFIRAGRKFATQLMKYENAPPCIEVRQGDENAEIAFIFGKTVGDPSVLAKERPEFTADYDIYQQALVPKSGTGEDIPQHSVPPMRRPFRRTRSDTIM